MNNINIVNTCYSSQTLIKLEFSRKVLEKYSNIKYHV